MRIKILITLLLFFQFLGCTDQKEAGQQKPNIILIMTDDQGYGDLGCFGSNRINTPHIDRMAKEGRKFTHFCVTAGVCTPSRASIMTGLRPDTLDMHTLKHELREKNPNVVTLGQLFRNNGYYSARAGKIYHYGNPSQIGTDGNDDPGAEQQLALYGDGQRCRPRHLLP